MGKRAIFHLSIIIWGFLLICTIISTCVYDALLPRVTPYTPKPGIINDKEYQMLVPASAVYQDAEGYYVFRLKETENKNEWKVERCSVSIEATNGVYVAIKRVVVETIVIAISPPEGLDKGGIVKIIL